MNTIVVQPTGGLCNYLRVVFSYYEYAKQQGKSLIVIWYVTDACNGYYLDYFQPVDGIIFKKDNNDDLPIDYKGCSTHSEIKPNYSMLKLIPELQETINKKIVSLENYIAIHVRRTDHIELAKSKNRFTTDEEFIQFVNQYPEHNLYVATDNRKTQDMFIEKFPEKIKEVKLINKEMDRKHLYFIGINGETREDISNCLRKTDLSDAITDIFVCVGSSKFKGSGWSSFSDFIKDMRGI